MKLSVLKRSQSIQQIDLGKDVLAHDYSETIFLIGRSKDCHIVLDDKKISREHARIIHNGGKWLIEKTSPDNMCMINGEDFNRHECKHGDVFTVENFSITIDLESQGTQTASLRPPVQLETIQQVNTIIEEKPVKKTTVTATDHTIPAADISIDNDDKDMTTEIDISELTAASLEAHNLKQVEQQDSSEEVEFQDEPEDALATLNGITHSDDNSNPSIVNQSTESDYAMEEGGEVLQDDENMSYSLENIDNDDDSTKVIQSFSSVYLELFGDTAPYDRYIIEKEKTFIGRDPAKCQIILNDTEVSTVHAVITRNNMMLTLEDLNSSNGTIHKGDRINKVMLGHNDEFVIGGVSFTVKIRSEFIKDESSTLMAVDENQTVEVEEVVEIQAEEGEELDALGNMVSSAPQEKSIIKRIWKDEAKRKKLIYVLVALVLAWVMLEPEEKPAPATTKKPKAKVAKVAVTTGSKKELTDEQKRAFSALYEIGKDHYSNGRYREALNELQKIAIVDPNFNASLQQLISFSKEGLRKIEEEEKKRIADIQAAEKKAKVKELLEKAREYTKDRRVDLANTTFNDITQLEPENIEVTRMKLELDDWQREKQRKELEEVQKKKDREDKVERLKPSRSLYLQKEWFKAIGKLEEFLRIKDMDDDLTTEATEMLKVSKDELNAAVAPLVGKAKSLMEGQDLKGAYEVYQQILRVEPSNSEALNQVGDIRDQLANRARKIYREAIIAESLSLFPDAKEKYQEVQQISPVDSEYYKKASEKLRDYLE